MPAFPKVPPRLWSIFPDTPVYFVTACTYRRRPIIATPRVQHAFTQFAQRAYTDHTIAVGRYVIMPDHVHLFVCGPHKFELGRWMGSLKQCLEKQVDCVDQRHPASPTGRRLQKRPLWQRGFFDHLLRSDESYAEKWNYVRDNPVRAGLVAKADDWPYAGEIIEIDRV